MFHSFGRVGLLVSLLLALLCPSSAAAGDLEIANAWASLPAPYENPSAYFVIQSRDSKARKIVGANCSGCDWAEIRRAAFKDGVMGSETLDEMEIPAGGTVAFVPRGLSLSLVGLGTLNAGDTLSIELEFGDGEKIEFKAVVRAK